MSLAPKIILLLILGYSHLLCGQVGFSFDQQTEHIQSVVFSNNKFSQFNNSHNNLALRGSQRKSGMQKEFKAFLIWTGIGLVSGYALVTLSVLKNGPYEDHLTKGETIWFFGTIATLVTLPVGMGIGLMHAISISSGKPKEKPKYLF